MKWKLISAGLIGGALGGLVGWAVTADAADRKRKSLEDDVHDMAQALTEKSVRIRQLERDLAEAQKPEVEDLVEIDTSGEVEEVKDKEELSPDEEEQVQVARANLQALIEPYVSGEDPIDEFVDKNARKMIKVNRGAPPEVISKELYAWDPDGPGDEYEKTTLTFYPKQRILLDEDQDLVDQPDVDAMVGWKNLNSFGGESGDPYVVFIRNHHLATDFEVVMEVDDDPPLHVQFGMPRQEFEMQKAAGTLVFREEDV